MCVCVCVCVCVCLSLTLRFAILFSLLYTHGTTAHTHTHVPPSSEVVLSTYGTRFETFLIDLFECQMEIVS